MKDAENDRRNSDRDTVFAKVKALFQSPDIESKTKDAAKLMKKVVRVTNEMFATSVNVFNDHGFECFGTPYKYLSIT